MLQQYFQSLNQCFQVKHQVPRGENLKGFAKKVSDMQMYKQYEDCLKLIFWHFLIFGRELLQPWAANCGTFLAFLVYVLASHLASFKPHQLSEGVKALILNHRSNSTWNDSPEKLWQFVRNGGLSQFLEVGDTLEGARQVLQEMADKCSSLNHDLQWFRLLTSNQSISPQQLSNAACNMARDELNRLGFREVNPKCCSKRKREGTDSSQPPTDADVNQALERLISKAENTSVRDDDAVRQALCKCPVLFLLYMDVLAHWLSGTQAAAEDGCCIDIGSRGSGA